MAKARPPGKPKASKRPKRPQGTTLYSDYATQVLRCPACNNIADLDDYDCGGADEDCVFCNNCQTEIQL
jgi:hypothetical protein